MPSTTVVDLPAQTVPVFQLGNEQAWSDEEVLYLLTRYLSGRCDGARTKDGSGYNRWDATLGNSLAEKEWQDWTDYDLWLSYKMLRRYAKTQLRDYWLHVPMVERPVSQWEREKEQYFVEQKQRHDPTWKPQVDFRVLAVSKDDEGQDVVEIKFKYDAALVNLVRALPQRRWIKDQRRWVVPLHLDAMDPLLDFAVMNGFDVDPAVAEAIQGEVDRMRDAVALSHASTDDLVIAGIREGLHLLPFQSAGVRYLSAAGSGLCADDMGLGKTIQFLATVQHTDAWPALLVCPASLKRNWQREARRWLPHLDQDGRIAVLSGSPREDLGRRLGRIAELQKTLADGVVGVDWTKDGLEAVPADDAMQTLLPIDGSVGLRETLEIQLENHKQRAGDVWPLVSGNLALVVVNYDILRRWLPILARIPFKTVGFDEAHKMKSSAAQRTKAGMEVAEGIERVICLTGTPVMNRPDELWTIIALTRNQQMFGGHEKFTRRYVGYDTIGTLEELNQRLRSKMMIRRTKDQVLKELPPKRMVVVPIELDNRAEYEKAEADLAHWYATKKADEDLFELGVVELLRQDPSAESAQGIVELIDRARKEKYDSAYRIAESNEQLMRWEILKQVSVKGKMAGVYDWIDAFLESGESLVVFAWHTAIVKAIAEKYDWSFISGEVPPDKRLPIVDQFQRKEVQGIVGNLLAMGEGLTLTAASNSATIELGWNPAQHVQAEDRLHRIGQTDSVTSWYLVAEQTIEDEVAALIAKKRIIIDAIHDGIGEQKQTSLINDLAERMKRKLEEMT